MAASALTDTACSAPRSFADAVWTLQTDRPWLPGTSQALTPVVDGESVFFCGGYSTNDDATVYAIGRSDGIVKWQRPVGRCENPLALLDTTLVVVASQDSGARCVIEGYDPADGRSRWRQVYESGGCARGGAAANGVMMLVGEHDRQVMTIRASDGQVRRFDVPDAPAEPNRLWIAASESVGWFGLGARVWRWAGNEEGPRLALELSESAGTPEHAVTVAGMLVLGDRRPGNLRGFDLESGTMLWHQGAFPQILSVSAAGAKLFANIWRQRFELVELDTRNGIERWTAGDGGFLPPTMSLDGWLYANGEFSVFVADPADGHIVDTIESGDEIITSPVHAGDMVLFGTIQGALHAVRAPQLKR